MPGTPSRVPFTLADELRWRGRAWQRTYYAMRWRGDVPRMHDAVVERDACYRLASLAEQLERGSTHE